MVRFHSLSQGVFRNGDDDEDVDDDEWSEQMIYVMKQLSGNTD